MTSPTSSATDRKKVKLSGATNLTTMALSAPATPVISALMPKAVALYIAMLTPMARAAIGSMATYPFYHPITLERVDGAPYRLGHYTVQVQDGEDRNPFTTDVAEENGCDLVIVSSISAPYKYLHGFGSLADRGYSAMYQQKTAQSRDAKQEDIMQARRTQYALYRASREILQSLDCGPEALDKLHDVFERLAGIDHVRLRIYPDPDIATENRILRTLDPLEFTPKAVTRALDLGRMVARRVLAGYRFEFLERG